MDRKKAMRLIKAAESVRVAIYKDGSDYWVSDGAFVFRLPVGRELQNIGLLDFNYNPKENSVALGNVVNNTPDLDSNAITDAAATRFLMEFPGKKGSTSKFRAFSVGKKYQFMDEKYYEVFSSAGHKFKHDGLRFFAYFNNTLSGVVMGIRSTENEEDKVGEFINAVESKITPPETEKPSPRAPQNNAAESDGVEDEDWELPF